MPAETSETARLLRSGSQAVTAAIIGTKKLPAAPNALVLDAGRFLAGTLGSDPRVRYFAVGVPNQPA